jgi:hypothetical protein
MTRRALLQSGAAAGLATQSASAAGERQILELTTYRLRNSLKNERDALTAYLRDGLLPGLKRAGAGPVGCFTNLVAEDGPSILSVTSYSSLAALEAVPAKLADDKGYLTAAARFHEQASQSPVRIEKSLLRAFSSVPRIETPGAPGEGAARIFELRIYESNTARTLAEKIRMFDQGEVAIFRRCGIHPVFFGETIAGTRMPNLTYLVWYESWAARDAAWSKFLADPEWVKLRGTPGWSDGEIVSNISNSLLRALPFSEIR